MAGSEKWVVRWLETLHFTGSRINVNKYILARKNHLERGQKSFFVFLICMISPGGRPHEIVGNALPKVFKIPWKRPIWSWLERFFWALRYHIKQIASITSQCPGKGISAQKKDSRKRRNSSLSVFYYNYSFKYTLRIHWQLINSGVWSWTNYVRTNPWFFTTKREDEYFQLFHIKILYPHPPTLRSSFSR